MLNLPNLLTLCRFALIPLYILVFSYEYYITAFLIVVLAGITDIFDGYIARSRGQVTPLGVVLDPLADKSMMLVVICSLLYSNIITWEAAIAIFVRDVGMIIGSALLYFQRKQTVPANLLGKLTTVLFYTAIVLLLLEVPYSFLFLWFVILFSFVSSANYIVKVRAMNSKQAAMQKEHIYKGHL